nr:reverse transcriptase domain-containing protein [Tanacetum cinerariifolium]
MARMDAMTIKMVAQYKELQSRAKQPTPDLKDDDMPMSREEDDKFMQTFSGKVNLPTSTSIFSAIPAGYWNNLSVNLTLILVGLRASRDSFAYKEYGISKVLLILGRPFLYTADAVIRVKQKQLNLGVGTERMIFNIDFVMKHSYSNDDTCFSIDVVDEILKEDFEALLDEGSKILHSIEGTLLEKKSFLNLMNSWQ